MTRWSRAIAAGVIIIAVSMAAGIAASKVEDARRAADSETIECLTAGLSSTELRTIARFGVPEDFRPLWSEYAKVFPRCVNRSDQWERKGRLMYEAWEVLRIQGKIQ